MNLITVDAIVTNGMLKPTTPLSLAEGTKVRLQMTVLPQVSDSPVTFDSLAGVWGPLSADDLARLEQALQNTH